MTYDFKEQLAKGQAGEQLIHDYFSQLERLDGFSSDFIINGKGIELKTDFYDPTVTPNFLIERYSDSERLTDGGPWKALKDGSQYYLYLFYQTKELYIIDTKDLVTYLDANHHHFNRAYIPNKTWVTMGYKVPRHLLTAIYQKITLTDTHNKDIIK